MGVAARAYAFADRLSEALSRKKYVVLVLFSVAYVFETCYFASRKLFWFDELFTIYISRLPDLASIWHALSEGVDANPPLLYELTRVSELLFGEGPVAARLPGILGFGIFCLCLFRFVSIRSSALGGIVSMLFPLVTGASWYAYDARSYGAVLGFGGVALICWQGAAMRSERRLGWLVGLAGALACAMLTHSYALLLFIPIGCGELARSVSRKRVDWPVWAAIIIASAAMVPSFMLLRSVISSGGSIVGLFQPTLPKLAQAYQSYLAPAAGVLFGALVLTLAAQMSRPSAVTQPIHAGKHQPHELVALFVFLLIPFFAYLAAKTTGAPFMPRYGILCIAGFASLLGITVARRPVIATGVLFLLAAQIGISFVQFVRSPTIPGPISSMELSTYAPYFMRRYAMMDRAPDRESPIVVLDDLEFLPTFYYAPANLASRLTYLVHSKADGNGLIYLKLRKCCNVPGNAFHLADFLSSHDRFLVFGGPRSLHALNHLIDAGAIIVIDRISNDDFLFSVKITK